MERAVKGHAKSLLQGILPRPFDDEVFLAGGAFKPLINPAQGVRDLDLWVRDRKVRERLVDHLTDCGAELVHDFKPYCIKFERKGQLIEITYQNVKQRPISEIVEGFDIACCAIAATYDGGQVTDCYVSPRAVDSASCREVMLTAGYIRRLQENRPPDILQSLDRMRRFSEEVDFELPERVSERLWRVFEGDYTDEQREACVDTYLSTTVNYKGRCDFDILRRASGGGVVPAGEALLVS